MKLLYKIYKKQEIKISPPVVLKIVESPPKKRQTENPIEVFSQKESIQKDRENMANVKKEGFDLAKRIIERARVVQQDILLKTQKDVEKMLIDAKKKKHEGYKKSIEKKAIKKVMLQDTKKGIKKEKRKLKL